MKSQPAEVGSLESSLSELRDPTQYVDLKNLGATCYVNSLIQMWFHNEDMRYAIYILIKTESLGCICLYVVYYIITLINSMPTGE